MVQWTTESRHGSLVHSAMIDAIDWKSFSLSLKDFWMKLLSAVAHLEFERLTLELWTDSGRLIGYPVGTGVRGRAPCVIVQVISSLVLIDTEKLPDPDINPDDFEAASAAIEAKVWQAVRKASNAPEVRSLKQAIRLKHSFSVWRQTGNDSDTSEEFFLGE